MIKCTTLNCGARTLTYSVDGGAPAVAFVGLPRGRALYPAVCVCLGAYEAARVLVLEH
jgi:hypothetical protein